MSSEEQKAVIVTGGGTGIGLAITEKFVAAGALVLITGRREAPLKEVSGRFPGSVFYIVADITDADQRGQIIPFAKEKFGRLNALVNNAGRLWMGEFVESTDEEYEACWATNVVAPAALMRDAIPSLEETGGSIVNVSSVTGRANLPGTSVYAATKAAMDHLTKICAVELGPRGIRVNAVAPGATRTAMVEDAFDTIGEEAFEQMIPLGRLGAPTDVAKVVFYLASEEANWVTGQIVEASGGMSL